MSDDQFFEQVYKNMGHIAEKLEIDEPYYSVTINRNSHGKKEYSSYLAIEKLNGPLMFSDLSAIGLNRQLISFYTDLRKDYVKIKYHKKELESLSLTQKFHEKQIEKYEKNSTSIPSL